MASVEESGVKIDVIPEDNNSFSVFFTNAAGYYSIPPAGVEHLKGFKSQEEALKEGVKFVQNHQWQYVEKMSPFKIFVRLWWDGEWGYKCGEADNKSGYRSREEAIEAARKAAQEKIDERNKL